MLDLEANQLGHLVSLAKLLDKLEVGEILHIVLEGGENEIEQPVWVELEVAYKLLDILFHLHDSRRVYIGLVELNDELGEALGLLSHQVVLLLRVEGQRAICRQDPLHEGHRGQPNLLQRSLVKDLMGSFSIHNTLNLELLVHLFDTLVVLLKLLFVGGVKRLAAHPNCLQ